MSAGVEVVRNLYSTFARGEIDAALETLDPKVEWETPETLPWSKGNYRAREGVLEYFRSFAGALEDASVDPDRLLGCGSTVVALGHERATARATGSRFEAPFAHVYAIEDGLIKRFRGHVDTAAIATAFEREEVLR